MFPYLGISTESRADAILVYVLRYENIQKIPLCFRLQNDSIFSDIQGDVLGGKLQTTSFRTPLFHCCFKLLTYHVGQFEFADQNVGRRLPFKKPVFDFLNLIIAITHATQRFYFRFDISQTGQLFDSRLFRFDRIGQSHFLRHLPVLYPVQLQAAIRLLVFQQDAIIGRVNAVLVLQPLEHDGQEEVLEQRAVLDFLEEAGVDGDVDCFGFLALFVGLYSQFADAHGDAKRGCFVVHVREHGDEALFGNVFRGRNGVGLAYVYEQFGLGADLAGFYTETCNVSFL